MVVWLACADPCAPSDLVEDDPFLHFFVALALLIRERELLLRVLLTIAGRSVTPVLSSVCCR